ncbi:MAG: glycosyltransferase family 61 protein [Alphaproteobacteria bacterium]|nr:glycosyltransferase family 61 protein [Alphaproteobacteria bacterium]
MDDWRLTTMADWAERSGAPFRPLRPAVRPARDPLDRLALPCPDYVRRVADEWSAVGEPARFVATIPEALVVGPHGVVGAADGTLFYDSFQAIQRIGECGFTPARALPAPPDWEPSVTVPPALFGLPVRPGPVAGRRLAGTSLLVGFMWDHNYYHWMLEALPRLALLDAGEAGSVDRLLLLAPRHAYKIRSLELAGLDPSRVEWIGDETVACERVVFPSRICRTGWVSRDAVDWLRRRLAPAERGGSGRRLFVSRGDTANRRMLNEDEVFEVFRARGFERVASAGLTLDQQIALFSQAEAVVAPHGAGMVNSLFMRPGGLVVDIMSASYLNPGIWTLCDAAGLAYQPVIGPPARDGGDFAFPAEQARQVAAALFDPCAGSGRRSS